MRGTVLLYSDAILRPIQWIAHLFQTRAVVKAFGLICSDNARIITMEWIGEGIALIFVKAVVAAVTLVDHASLAARPRTFSPPAGSCTPGGFPVHRIQGPLHPLQALPGDLPLVRGPYIARNAFVTDLRRVPLHPVRCQ